jgi:threonine/homoserine/homoserine lactone efflux protein
MDVLLLFKGMFIGIAIAAPVGPIGVLCIRRTLVSGQLSGFISGLGIATADGAYAAVAAFGITYISNIVVGKQLWFGIIGGSLLLLLGIKTLVSRPSEKGTLENKNFLLGNYFSMFLLTATNPLTIVYFTAVFAGLGPASRDYVSPALMVTGVILGSTLWWFLLSYAVNHFRSKFNIGRLKIVNLVSGSVIVILAAIAIFTAFH